MIFFCSSQWGYALRRSFLVVGLLFTLSVNTVFAVCKQDIEPTTPITRFNLHQGEAWDKKTGLIWDRCAVGQKFEKNKCLGSPRLMTLDQSLAYTKKLSGGWRIPTAQELLTIIEYSCRNPAVNSRVFPNVEELYEGHAKFWSQTTIKELPDMMFYNVDLLDGSVDANSRGIGMGLRLVKDKGK